MSSMDKALLKEREAFRKRALALPAVEKRKAVPIDNGSSRSKPSKKSRPTPPVSKPAESSYDYKSMQGSSKYKFAVLAKTVKFMRQRHQQGDGHPLTLDEILDETNQLDVGPRYRVWLGEEALRNNPKIEVVNGDQYRYKPKYNIRDRKGLRNLLDKHDQRGLGGIFIEDVEEAVPKAEKVLKQLGDKIIYMTRPDKRKVLFYNDKAYQFKVDEDFVKMWRSVAVEGVDEKKIEEYLERQGITSMQDIGGLKPAAAQKRKKGARKGKNFKSHNDHISGILKDFSDDKK